jgi:hypothetical protein
MMKRWARIRKPHIRGIRIKVKVGSGSEIDRREFVVKIWIQITGKVKKI